MIGRMIRRGPHPVPWLPERPEWMDPIQWLRRQFYLIADENAVWWKIIPVMARVRGFDDTITPWEWQFPRIKGR